MFIRLATGFGEIWWYVQSTRIDAIMQQKIILKLLQLLLNL